MIRLNKNVFCLIFVLFFISNTICAQNENRKRRVEFGLKLDITDRHKNEYFNSSTGDSSIAQYMDSVYPMKERFMAINFNLKYFYPKNFMVVYEFRWRTDGFKGNFVYPSFRVPDRRTYTGYAARVTNVDLNVVLMKRYKWESFELRPRIGLHLVAPFFASNSSIDSNVYQNFGDSEFTMYYKGNALKLGYTVGGELCYNLSKTINFSLSANYYSPFNNSYTWHYSERAIFTHYPWVKSRIKASGMYIGLGVNVTFRKGKFW